MEKNIIEEYERLKKKHNLPSFDVLNSEFEISEIEANEFLLRNIIRCIAEKLDFYAKTIESNILQPDTNLASLHEVKFISNSEKAKIYEIFMQIMFLERWATETLLKMNEGEEANYIFNTTKEWQSIRKELLPFFTTIKQAWINKKLIQDEINYFG
ncbi:MAG: hypothetical protein QW331_01150 [Candidatus Woesearchaeota archaeon]